MTKALDRINQIVAAETFVLNDAVMERVLNLLIEAVAGAGKDHIKVNVQGLGVLDAIDAGGRLEFILHLEQAKN